MYGTNNTTWRTGCSGLSSWVIPTHNEELTQHTETETRQGRHSSLRSATGQSNSRIYFVHESAALCAGHTHMLDTPTSFYTYNESTATTKYVENIKLIFYVLQVAYSCPNPRPSLNVKWCPGNETEAYFYGAVEFEPCVVHGDTVFNKWETMQTVQCNSCIPSSFSEAPPTGSCGY